MALRKRVQALEHRAVRHEERIEELERAQAQAMAKLRELIALNEQVLEGMAKLSDKLDRLLDAMEGDRGRGEG